MGHHLTTRSRAILICGWEPFTLCNHCATFDAYRFCGSGDILFPFCHTMSHDNTIKGHVTW